VHTWTHPNFSRGITTVSWLLQEDDELTTVSLHHEGIENLFDAGPEFASENYQIGWDQILSNLKKFVNEKD
jgi:methionyl-tRNA formyltransferase